MTPSTVASLVRRVRRSVASRLGGDEIRSEPDRHDLILNAYVRDAPNPQLAVDLFGEEWASLIPDGPAGAVRSGRAPLFDDPRVHWASSVFGGFEGMRALELGPLEGGHSYMLDRAGAASIDAIEANTKAYLKCLIVKELVGLDRVRFHLGDFMSFVREPDELVTKWLGANQRFDVVLASGVLYHMREPVELLAALAELSDRLFVWTHYFDREMIDRLEPNDRTFEPVERRTHDGFEYESAVQNYGQTLANEAFCGGPEHQSRWLTRDSLLAVLHHVGYDDVRIDFDEPAHQNGPAIAICATRSMS